MMDLKTQIILIVFSFFYGFIFSIFLNINYKFIYSSKPFIKILSSFLIIIIAVLVYFISIKKINNAILHPYSIIMVIIGFFVDICINRIIAKKTKKWYTDYTVGWWLCGKKKSNKRIKKKTYYFWWS